jgi:Fe-S oxidoreductase
MNPGKAIDAYAITSNLRLQTPERDMPLDTHFAFSQDQGRFQHAALRCVGVGKCRRQGGGVMCPSYLATREEMHSTRGRARLLFEMLHEGALSRGWRSEAVHEALDLCLACKGCKHDCPVNVDMATYKAEFHAHYYAHRLRPRSAYAFGLVHRWARLAAHMPSLVNGVSQSAAGAALMKWMADVAPARQLPRFARPFTRDYTRAHTIRGEQPVLLWPDTFNNFMTPQVLHAAVAVLRAAGFTPIVPRRRLCCGRPLYAWGWIDRARRLLEDLLEEVSPHIAAGTPLVGLEPACVSALRDELCELFPKDPRAKALAAHSHLLSEFLSQVGYRPVPLNGPAIVHWHCHHRSSLGTDSASSLLEALGLDVQTPEPGCCGMAGEFGFESRHYEVSMKIAERALLPAVRRADAATLLVANGYSCREQIRQGTGKAAVHLAEVLERALEPGPKVSGPGALHVEA